MLEAMEGGFNVFRHREVAGSFLVVPFYGDTKLGTVGPVGSGFIFGF